MVHIIFYVTEISRRSESWSFRFEIYRKDNILHPRIAFESAEAYYQNLLIQKIRSLTLAPFVNFYRLPGSF
jgi:hypothetical protein